VARLNEGIAIAPDDGQTYFAIYSLLADHGRSPRPAMCCGAGSRAIPTTRRPA
jgi:hypothetical protein